MVIVNRVDEIVRLTEKFHTDDMGRDMEFDTLTVCPDFCQTETNIPSKLKQEGHQYLA
ncbi:MAG: hypothetical protein QG646_1969 [Euryarchaeota archaeon]|nr:hypothetical protein [Euryarchaeota archaeon]